MSWYVSKVFDTDDHTTITQTPDEYYFGKDYVLTITADEGYTLDYVRMSFADRDEVVELTDEVQGKQSISFTLDQYFSYSTLLTNPGKLTVVARSVGEQIVEYYEDFENITSNHLGNTIKQDDRLVFTTAKGYKFDEIEFTFYSGGSVADSLTLIAGLDTWYFFENDTKFILDIEEFWKPNYDRIEVYARPISYVYYEEDLKSVNSNLSGEIKESDTLILETLDNEEFIGDIIITVERESGTEELRYNKNTHPDYFEMVWDVESFILPLSEIWSDDIKGIHVKATGGVIEEVTYHETLHHVTSNIPTTPVEGEEFASGKIRQDATLILTADEGFEFQDGIRIAYSRTTQPTETFIFYPNSETHAKYFNEDFTQFTYRIDEYWDYGIYSIKVYASAFEKYTGGDDLDDSTTDFANVYLVDNGILTAITAKRFTEMSNPDGTPSSVPMDMGQYIYQVYKLPLKLEEDLISKTTTPIRMGFHNTEVQSKYLLRSRVKYDLGRIEVPEEYNNVYDYKDTTVLLHVPYATPIEIDPTYVIGSAIEMVFFLDLYNGTVTLEVYSDKIDGDLVLREDVKLTYEIPFIQPRYNDVLGHVGRVIYNKVNTPFVEVIRPIPYDTETEQGKEGKEVGKLRDFTGYVEVRDVKLEGNITEKEREKIINLLTTGVYINEEDKPVEPYPTA